MENKIKDKLLLEFNEEELNFLLECVTVVSQIKWKGYNSKVEPLRQRLKACRNDLINARIEGLRKAILELENSKNDQKTNEEILKNSQETLKN